MLKIKHVPFQLFDVTVTPIMFTLLFTYMFGGALAGSPEVYIHFTPEVFAEEGQITNESTKEFLRNYLAEYHDHVVRVLTVLPRQ